MYPIQLPEYPTRRLRENNADKIEIFDEWRQKYVSCSPEEWVRQHFLHYLVNWAGYPKHRIAVEKKLKVGDKLCRFDALVYNKMGLPAVLLEFKRPSEKINQSVCLQAAQYNLILNVPFIGLSNGIETFFIHMGPTATFMNTIPNPEEWEK
jgi:hypothetical protein